MLLATTLDNDRIVTVTYYYSRNSLKPRIPTEDNGSINRWAQTSHSFVLGTLSALES